LLIGDSRSIIITLVNRRCYKRSKVSTCPYFVGAFLLSFYSRLSHQLDQELSTLLLAYQFWDRRLNY